MRTLQRNKRPVWFCLYLGVQELQDTEGNFTGEYAALYDAPQRVLVNVSPASGKDAIAIFGTDEQYDKVIVVDWDTETVFSPHDYDGAVTADNLMFGVGQIDENTVWFIDTLPTGNSPDGFDYVVKRVAKSLNSITIAVQKVNNET